MCRQAHYDCIQGNDDRNDEFKKGSKRKDDLEAVQIYPSWPSLFGALMRGLRRGRYNQATRCRKIGDAIDHKRDKKVHDHYRNGLNQGRSVSLRKVNSECRNLGRHKPSPNDNDADRTYCEQGASLTPSHR
jgi:hypothetical protein